MFLWILIKIDLHSKNTEIVDEYLKLSIMVIKKKFIEKINK